MNKTKLFLATLFMVISSCSDSSASKTFTVTWKNWNGTILEVDYNVKDGTYPSYNGNTPKRPNDSYYSYSFDGWTPSLMPVTSDIVYTAHYNSIRKTSFTVTWKNWDGIILEIDNDVAEGTYPSYDGNIPTRNSDSHYSYSFDGWTPSLMPVTSDIVYTALYSSNTRAYTVIWKNWNGAILETDLNVPYGSTPTYNGSTPSKDPDNNYTYTFMGWNPAIAPVTKDSTYIAVFNSSERVYECDNVYHWRYGESKTSHSYSLTSDTDSLGYITLECDICHHQVRERATCSYNIDTYSGTIWIQDYYNYIDGTKDFVVPPLVINTPTRYFGSVQHNGNGNYSFVNSNPFLVYLKDVENIWLPPTFTRGSFDGLCKLKQINIQDTMCTSIGNHVNALGGFMNCESIVEIKLPSSLILAPTNQNATSDQYTRNLFYSCKSLKKVIFNSEVRTLAPYCFSGCVSLEEYSIPSSVTALSFRVFGRKDDGKDNDNYKLKKLIIPSSVTTISNNAIVGCDNLTIYCEAQSKPSGWSSSWNPDNRPVVWGYVPE